jgi:uncharacterized damage-inducible protein DinB
MRRIYFVFLGLAMLTLGLASLTEAQDKPAANAPAVAAAPAAPASGARAEFLEEIAYYEKRFTRLADGVPADKYSWRPADGVRSVGEVYAHIAAANYGIARALGIPPPAGIDPKAIMASATDKAKIVQALKDSFAHFKQAILAISDADLDKPQKMFGHDTTRRGAFFLITGHLGEHLGQSIAYARVNGIVPPWTAEAQQQKPADKPKQ